ncbi:MAG: peptidylprolyl isomerase [Fimbriimonadaceae bacterium]|nr:peptidylprolyl isomerase [Fimbriimonadaceae bacterium]
MNTSSQDKDEPEQKPAAAPYTPIATPKDGEEVAIVETDEGRIVLGFLRDKAPKHVENFIKLAKKGYYDGTKFHRVMSGFMIQGGDPNTKNGDPSTWGTGGPSERVNAEFNDVEHKRGILSMARGPEANSAGSQFFIMHGENANLNGQYSAFGYVIEGMDTVDKIAEAAVTRSPSGENSVPVNPVTLKSAKIEKWPLK